MQPTLCSRCHKNVAVIFIQKMEGGTTKSEGLCLKCAKEMGIKPVDDMMQKMGISDEDLEGLTNEMMSAFGGAEGMEGLMSAEEADEDEEDEGKTATFPFLNKLFGSAQSPKAQPPEREQPRAERGDKDKKGEKQHRQAGHAAHGKMVGKFEKVDPHRHQQGAQVHQQEFAQQFLAVGHPFHFLSRW